MGEFNKDQGQQDQTGQFGNKSAFGQFDNDQNQQDRVERTQQDGEEFAGAEDDTSASRGEAMGGQQQGGEPGDFGSQKGQQEQNQDRGQEELNQDRGQQQQDQGRGRQGDDQYMGGKGGDQNR